MAEEQKEGPPPAKKKPGPSRASEVHRREQKQTVWFGPKRALVNARARKLGYRSVSEYIADLINRDVIARPVKV
jgi:hypothetical protein